ncbi:MAG: DNA ligase [Lachnospiraceae bacterium]
MDIFAEKGILPMLIGEQKEAFDSPEYIFEVKFDGIRCIAYLDSTGTELRNKRNKKMLPHVPELSGIHSQIREKCILDGELFILKNGVTDFYEIQRRALTTDPFKIKIAGEKYPASFVAYDVLYYHDKLIHDRELMERKEILFGLIRENEQISISRYIETQGIALFETAKARNLEGVVAKKKNSKYWFDKRTKEWIKCKVMATDDCVICGYIQKEKGMTSLVLGQYDGDQLIYKGHVTLGVSLRDLLSYEVKKLDGPPFSSIPAGNKDAVWLKPELVCIVESMPTDKESFRQPVFRGIRNDKLPLECKI